MPVSLKKVQDFLSKEIREEVLSAAIAEIDGKLTDREWVKKMVRGDGGENFAFSFKFPDGFREDEATLLIHAYTEAGWGECCFMNNATHVFALFSQSQQAFQNYLSEGFDMVAIDKVLKEVSEGNLK